MPEPKSLTVTNSSWKHFASIRCVQNLVKATSQNKELLKKNKLKPQTKPKQMKLNPEIWKQILTPGFITRLLCTVHSLERQEPAARYSVNSPIHHRHGGIFSNFTFLSFLQCASAQQGPSLSRWHLACLTLASIWKNCFASASRTGASSAPVIRQ